MPLNVPPAPAPALRSVLTALGSPTAVREARTPSLLHAQGPATPELPLPVHVLDGIDAAGVPATRLAGWRFLIRCGDRMVAAAETMLTPDGWAFSRFFEGPYIASTEQALRQAEAIKQPYQARLLSIPGLYMLTLWLHGDCTADGATGHPAANDLLVPLAPAPPGIAAHRPHRVADLLPVLTHRVTPAPLLSSPA
ncbi:Secreted protein OS=Streptomyces alboniger OX=132473 GN=CP975_04915 PE=4 SV=1 [Streptomyces alboniger]